MIKSFPCPPECICRPTDMIDVDFAQMTYIIDCSNVPLNDNKLSYSAESWTINEDKITDNDDNDDEDLTNSYRIFLDLTNSSSLRDFHSQTIELTGFTFSIGSLSLASQSDKFILQSNAFNSSIFQNLKLLNLSSCCRQIPIECPQLFSPLEKLEILDLSGSDMFKNCLDKQGK